MRPFLIGFFGVLISGYLLGSYFFSRLEHQVDFGLQEVRGNFTNGLPIKWFDTIANFPKQAKRRNVFF